MALHHNSKVTSLWTRCEQAPWRSAYEASVAVLQRVKGWTKPPLPSKGWPRALLSLLQGKDLSRCLSVVGETQWYFAIVLFLCHFRMQVLWLSQWYTLFSKGPNLAASRPFLLVERVLLWRAGSRRRSDLLSIRHFCSRAGAPYGWNLRSRQMCLDCFWKRTANGWVAKLWKERTIRRIRFLGVFCEFIRRSSHCADACWIMRDEGYTYTVLHFGAKQRLIWTEQEMNSIIETRIICHRFRFSDALVLFSSNRLICSSNILLPTL